MQILSKFCHNKHLTHSPFAPVTRLYDNSVLSRYFTHHNAQMRCYSTVLLLYKKNKNIIINSKVNKYQQNYKQTILQ